MLKVTDLQAGYAGSKVLHSLSMHVDDGESVVVLGPNGHGKTTLLRAISGLIRPTAGTVNSMPDHLNKRPSDIVASGVIHPQESFSRTDGDGECCWAPTGQTGVNKHKLDEVLSYSPTERTPKQLARSLSGSERRMLALNGLMSKAKLLMIDEPSLGLAPFLIENVYEAIRNIRKTGLSILLVDENADHIAGLADRVYLLEAGVLIKEGGADEMLRDQALLAAYLG
jgi:branched-chain amino acid transport system ATP-binding protein